MEKLAEPKEFTIQGSLSRIHHVEPKIEKVDRNIKAMDDEMQLLATPRADQQALHGKLLAHKAEARQQLDDLLQAELPARACVG